MAPTDRHFTYPARLARVKDGDTLVFDLDLGFTTTLSGESKQALSARLFGLNCPEHTTPEGQQAKQAVIDWFVEHAHGASGFVFTVQSMGWDKYGGRYDAVVQCAQGHSLNQYLVQNRFAAAWDGQGPKPVPAG